MAPQFRPLLAGAQLAFTLEYPAEVVPGKSFLARVEVKNTGGVTGSFRAALISNVYGGKRFYASTPNYPNQYFNVPAGQTISLALKEFASGWATDPVMPDPPGGFADGTAVLVATDGADGTGADISPGQRVFSQVDQIATLFALGHKGVVFSRPFMDIIDANANKRVATPGDQLIISAILKNLGRDYKCWSHVINNTNQIINNQDFEFDPAAHDQQFVQNFQFTMPQVADLQNGIIYDVRLRSGHFGDNNDSTINGITTNRWTDKQTIIRFSYAGHFTQIASPIRKVIGRKDEEVRLSLEVKNDGLRDGRVGIRVFDNADNAITDIAEHSYAISKDDKTIVIIKFEYPLAQNYIGRWELINLDTMEIDDSGAYTAEIGKSNLIVSAPVADTAELNPSETTVIRAHINNDGQLQTTFRAELMDAAGNVYAVWPPTPINPGVHLGSGARVDFDFTMPNVDSIDLHIHAYDVFENKETLSSIITINNPAPPPKKYACINNLCTEDPNGIYDNANCDGACEAKPPSNILPLVIGALAGISIVAYAATRKRKGGKNG